MSKSDLEAAFLFYLRTLAPDLPEPEREWRFCDSRRFRFDFAWPEQKVVAELEGGTWGKPVYCHKCGVRVMSFTKTGKPYPVASTGGRHVRGRGYESDCEKYNLAMASGWRVFRVTAGMLERDPAGFIEMIAGIIKKEGPHG